MNLQIGFILLIFFPYGKSQSENRCGDWAPYEDKKCLKIFQNPGLVSYQDAENFCKQQDDSHLITISHKEEQDFIEKFLKSNEIIDNVWIGLKYVDEAYKWSDGTDLQYTNWADGGQKNNSSYCVEIETEDNLFGKWTDVPCGKKNLVICQKIQLWSFAELQTTVLKLVQDPVPMGFIYVQLPKEKSPEEIWPTVEWKDVSSEYEGLFFRTAGGKASAFGDVQEEDSPRLVHLNMAYLENEGECYLDTYPVPDPDLGAPLNIGGWTEFTGWCLKVRVSEGEVRPRNTAVKIWKRVEKSFLKNKS